MLNEVIPLGETGSGMLGFVDPQGPSWGFGSSASCGRVTDPQEPGKDKASAWIWAAVGALELWGAQVTMIAHLQQLLLITTWTWHLLLGDTEYPQSFAALNQANVKL